MVRGKLFILRGAPGSGKTTVACAMVLGSEPGRTVRMSRDDVRTMLMCDESGHLNDLADVVTEMYLAGIKIALRTGVDVVVDDVHAEWKYVMPLVDIAAENGAECEIVDVPASLEECLSRNKQRTGARRVTEQVVRNAYEKIVFHRESDNDE